MLGFEDQVDDLACATGAERPPSQRAGWVGLVLRSTVPRREHQRVEQIGIRRHGLVRECDDLVEDSRVRDEAVHLSPQAPADHRVHLLGVDRPGITSSGADVLSLVEQVLVTARLSLLQMSGVGPFV